jgi:hypothetical protein
MDLCDLTVFITLINNRPMNRNLIIPAILFSAFFSCKKSASNLQVDSPIIIQMQQSTQSGGPATFALNCSTGSYPDGNYRLNYSLSMNGNNIAVTFSDITAISQKPSISASAPATAYVALEVLNNGIYPLSFQIGSNTYKATLVVTDTDYTITYPNPSANLAFKKTAIKKVQVNTIWGTATAGSLNYASILNGIFDSLVMYGAQPYTGPVGDYYLFRSDSGFTYSPLSAGMLQKQFIYTYTGNYAKIDTLIRHYVNSQRDSLIIVVNTYTGQNNWVYIAPPTPVSL